MLQQKYLSILLLLLFLFGMSFSATDLQNTPEIRREIQLLEKWIDEIRNYYHIPGIAVGIVYDRDLIWSRGFGYANLDSAKLPVNMAVGYLRNFTNRPRPKALFTDSKGLTPAANLTSNVEDLARFCSLQFRTDSAEINPVLKPSTLREMQRIHWLYESWTGGWGLGFSIRKTEKYVLIGHAGWVSGYRSQILFTPKEKVAVIVLINTDDYRPYEIAWRVLEQVTSAIFQVTQPTPAPSQFHPEWKMYAGQYIAPDQWQTDVMLLNNKLYLYNYNYPPEMEPVDNLTELVPEGQHTFRMSGANGNGEKVVFFMNEQQQVIKIKVGENYIFHNLANQNQ